MIKKQELEFIEKEKQKEKEKERQRKQEEDRKKNTKKLNNIIGQIKTGVYIFSFIFFSKLFLK